MRGFFCVLFVLVASSACGAAFGGEVTGSLGPDGYAQTWYFFLDRQLADADLLLGLQWQQGSEKPLHLTPRWRLETRSEGPFRLRTGQGVDHYSSSDLFRMIGKNQHTPETTFAAVESEQFSLGLLRQVPLRGGDAANAAFSESMLTVGPLALRGLSLHYANPEAVGAARILQASGAFRGWEAAAAWGLIWKAGEVSRGAVLELKRDGEKARASLSWQSIEPGFESLLAKSNRYTPNRVGWELELAAPLGSLEMGLHMRRQVNWERSREYNRLSCTLLAGDSFRVEWRLEPTQALILRREAKGVLWQIDLLSQVLRFDRDIEEGRLSFRADGQRRIARLELQLDKTVQWRVVVKRDFLRDFTYFYLRARWGRADRHFQLELGEHDGGNLPAGFGQPHQLRLSWTLRF
ncbi:MAG TPA: hypothetical protein GX393_02680 [Firmicutes bacterium]|jgi:hypothetical protein|nr:hypothetical protein [Bacillota bacterium]